MGAGVCCTEGQYAPVRGTTCLHCPAGKCVVDDNVIVVDDGDNNVYLILYFTLKKGAYSSVKGVSSCQSCPTGYSLK